MGLVIEKREISATTKIEISEVNSFINFLWNSLENSN